jgi:1-deoxy-D-xylulose 5-phosphate reductoisomerase
MKKNIVILGSNNILGVKALDFFKKYPNKFNIYGLSYDSNSNNIDLFIEQINLLNPISVYVEDKESKDKILNEIDYSIEFSIYCGFDEFNKFISIIDIDEILCSLYGIDSVKKILSIIHEFKDVTLLNTSPLLYSGKIIPMEAESKGVKLNVFSYPVYSLDQIFKFKNKDDIYKLTLFSLKRDITKHIDPIDYESSIEYIKDFYSINKLRVVNDLFIIYYLYDISLNKINFYNQSKQLLNVSVKFKDGSNFIHSASLKINSIFNYYFLENYNINNEIPEDNHLLLKLDKININDYRFLKLGIDALNKGSMSPIIFYIASEIMLRLIYHKKLKKNASIYNVLKELLNNQEFYSKHPDFSVIYAVEDKIKKYILSKYEKK